MFGFIGASDSHRAVPGLGGALTCVFAEELTPEALFDAYKKRRTMATQGIFLYADFRVNDTFIGGEGIATGSPLISAAAEAPDSIEVVDVIRDGEVIHHVTPDSRCCEITFRDETAQPGEHFYFMRVRLIGDPSFNIDPGENTTRTFEEMDGRYPSNLARARGVFAWTSPVWMKVE